MLILLRVQCGFGDTGYGVQCRLYRFAKLYFIMSVSSLQFCALVIHGTLYRNRKLLEWHGFSSSMYSSNIVDTPHDCFKEDTRVLKKMYR